jgi:hypothetical protein
MKTITTSNSCATCANLVTIGRWFWDENTNVCSLDNTMVCYTQTCNLYKHGKGKSFADHSAPGADKYQTW